MKTNVNQRIVKPSDRFLKKINKRLPPGVIDFAIMDYWMEHASGYGSYYFFLNIIVNGEVSRLRKFTHSSPDWDYYRHTEHTQPGYDNWVKRNVLDMLDADYNRIDNLVNY
jgi:hypothetical protein